MPRKSYQLPAGTRFLTPDELAARRAAKDKPSPGKTYGPQLTGSLDADLFGPPAPRPKRRRRGRSRARGALARARRALTVPAGIFRRPRG